MRTLLPPPGPAGLVAAAALLSSLAGVSRLAAQDCSATIQAPNVGSEVVLHPGDILAEEVTAAEVQYVNPFGVRRRRWEEATVRYRFVGRTGEYAYGFEEITAREGDRGEQVPTVLRLSYWVPDDTTTFRLGDLTLRLTPQGGSPIVRVVATGSTDRSCRDLITSDSSWPDPGKR